jgi:membrane protein implicated in regulation of membrane protease activity
MIDTNTEHNINESNKRQGRSDVLSGLVEGKRRILLSFSHYGEQVDDLEELAKKLGYTSGGGNFKEWIDELVQKGSLKRFTKNGRNYLKITRQGEISIVPLILPKIFTLFILLVSVILIGETVLTWMHPVAILSFPLLILMIGLILLVFSILTFFLVNRMESFLLELQNSTDERIVKYLKRRGGWALESEIVNDLLIQMRNEHLAVKRLERSQVVRIERVDNKYKVILL